MLLRQPICLNLSAATQIQRGRRRVRKFGASWTTHSCRRRLWCRTRRQGTCCRMTRSLSAREVARPVQQWHHRHRCRWCDRACSRPARAEPTPSCRRPFHNSEIQPQIQYLSALRWWYTTLKALYKYQTLLYFTLVRGVRVMHQLRWTSFFNSFIAGGRDLVISGTFVYVFSSTSTLNNLNCIHRICGYLRPMSWYSRFWYLCHTSIKTPTCSKRR